MTALGRILVIVPAFNQEQSIVTVVQNALHLRYDVCVVDDCSVDGTADSAADAGAYVLRLPVNLGVGTAVRCGFRWALEHGYGAVVQVNADSHLAPEQVQELLAALVDTGADMVIGSPLLVGVDPYGLRTIRRLAIKLLSARVRRMTGVSVLDASSEVRAIRRPLLDRFADTYPAEYQSVGSLIAAGRMGAKVVEHPIVMTPGVAGSDAGPSRSLWYLLRAIVAIELFPRRFPRLRITLVEAPSRTLPPPQPPHK